jgi:hypothetical protein
MRKKNYEFRSKFHNFWSSIEFPMNFQAYEYFLIFLIKFTWIWNPKLDSSFEFKGLNSFYSNTKFEQNLEEFKSTPNLIWIPIWIILRKNGKVNCSYGPHWNPWPQWLTRLRPTALAQVGGLWQPMPAERGQGAFKACAVRGHCVLAHGNGGRAIDLA